MILDEFHYWCRYLVGRCGLSFWRKTRFLAFPLKFDDTNTNLYVGRKKRDQEVNSFVSGVEGCAAAGDLSPENQDGVVSEKPSEESMLKARDR